MRAESDREESPAQGGNHRTVHQGTQDSDVSQSSEHHQDVWLF